MQIETTLRFHLTPVIIVITKNTTTNRCWWRWREKWTLIHCWWECKLVQSLWKTVCWLLKNIYIDLHMIQYPTPMDIPKGLWLHLLQKHLHTHVYWSTIHNSQVMETAKMPHYWWMDKKMWYLYTIEFYSALKKTEILSFWSKWKDSPRDDTLREQAGCHPHAATRRWLICALENLADQTGECQTSYAIPHPLLG
jgi:hypothetical protein